MMKKEIVQKMKKLGLWDPAYGCILIAAGVLFLYVSLYYFAYDFYEQFLPIPCVVFLGVLLGRGTQLKNKKVFILPAAMIVWFLITWMKRGVDAERVYSIGLFLTIYLFAFPLAFYLQDGNTKKALKIFAVAYLGAAAMLVAASVLLLLNWIPERISWAIFWDGARLQAFWHPNMTAAFLLIGTVLCVILLSQSGSRWTKVALSMLLILMLGAIALTNSRTTIILTGGYLGACLFFALIKRGKKWFVPGVLAAALVTVALFAGAGELYQANYDRLAREYVQQQMQQKEQKTPQTEQKTSQAEQKTPQIEQKTSKTEKKTQQAEQQEQPVEQWQTAEVPVTEMLETAHVVEKAEEKAPASTEKLAIGDVRLPTTSGQRTFEKDVSTLNGRTSIWKAAINAIRDDRSVLLWGVAQPGPYVSPYNHFAVDHLHNAWVEILLGMGLPGLLLAVLFTVMTAWNCLMVLLKHHKDIWKRNVALLALLLLAASMLEPYLFYTYTDYHAYNFLFFLCAGYLAHWQEEDNCRILAAIRVRILPRKQ